MHQFSPQAIRSEPKIGSDGRLSRDGENAADVLKHVKPKDKKWIETWLAAAVPGFKDVSTRTVLGRRVFVFAQEGDAGHAQLLDASQISDGTLRSLGILLALRQSPRPSIVMLDEIEDSLHPLAHGVLLDAIDEASEEFPIVVSTHSPEILNHPTARGERIRVIQWAEGTSRIYHLGETVRANLEPPLDRRPVAPLQRSLDRRGTVNDRRRGRFLQAAVIHGQVCHRPDRRGPRRGDRRPDLAAGVAQVPRVPKRRSPL